MEEELWGDKIKKMSDSEFKDFTQNIIEAYYLNSQSETPSCIIMPQKDWKRFHWRLKANKSMYSRHDIKKYGMKIKRANCFKKEER